MVTFNALLLLIASAAVTSVRGVVIQSLPRKTGLGEADFSHYQHYPLHSACDIVIKRIGLIVVICLVMVQILQDNGYSK
ncbi:hypothetical protein C8J57DRAFT_1515620 [Mycena rebaudengoi]|nr:hypothetical protein C8J57DRAFT_1515620 [Mycena rebaudengoi]